MRFIYADPGLKDEVGHHANACRAITGELRSRGIEPEVLAFKDASARVCEALGARPYFRAHTYWTTDGDAVCGWLSNFQRCWELTAEDLARLAPMGAGDALYLNSGQPSQFMGIAQWLRRLPDGQLPHVVMEFGTDPGVEIKESEHGYSLALPDPRVDERPTLHRFASLCVQQRTASHLHLATFDPFSSEVFGILINRPVGVLPLLQGAAGKLRLREGGGGITVAVLGHQRPSKGYELVPEVARLLLKADARVRLLIHNGEPSRLPEAQGEIRKLAARESRVRVDERVVGLEEWGGLLEEADVILCPYLPKAFRASYSALAAEAVASGIPLVGPEKTTVASLMERFGVGATFEKFDPASIAGAVLKVVGDFENQARRSLAAAEKWGERYGVKKTVNAILGVG